MHAERDDPEKGEWKLRSVSVEVNTKPAKSLQVVGEATTSAPVASATSSAVTPEATSKPGEVNAGQKAQQSSNSAVEVVKEDGKQGGKETPASNSSTSAVRAEQATGTGVGAVTPAAAVQ